MKAKIIECLCKFFSTILRGTNIENQRKIQEILLKKPNVTEQEDSNQLEKVKKVRIILLKTQTYQKKLEI